MSSEFRGEAIPLDAKGMANVLDRLGVKAPELWAVLSVETAGCGLLPDRRPAILYERHIFSRRTDHRFDESHPDISHRRPGNYGGGGSHQYDRLQAAINLDRRAALESASWGLGQLMGFNAAIGGYDDVEAMVAAMCASENNQLMAMARFMAHHNLDRALRNHDWAGFARGYNGPHFARNRYDTRLAMEYQRYASGSLPDLTVRTAQVYLRFLGHYSRAVDGLMGRFTKAAVHDFQEGHELPLDDEIDADSLARLKAEVDKLP